VDARKLVNTTIHKERELKGQGEERETPYPTMWSSAMQSTLYTLVPSFRWQDLIWHPTHSCLLGGGGRGGSALQGNLLMGHGFRQGFHILLGFKTHLNAKGNRPTDLPLIFSNLRNLDASFTRANSLSHHSMLPSSKTWCISHFPIVVGDALTWGTMVFKHTHTNCWEQVQKATI
jgi:hypothetical protein